MTKGQLVRYLEDYDDNCEVRIMTQQNWPFENAISDVVCNEDIPSREREDEEFETKDYDGKPNPKNRVFIVEGRQMCYGNKRAWRR
jgi:hypothetical protein